MQVEHTCNEKNLLFAVDNRFVVGMVDYFHDKVYVLQCNLVYFRLAVDNYLSRLTQRW